MCQGHRYTANLTWNNTSFPEDRGKCENTSCVWQIGTAKVALIYFSLLVTDRESGKRIPVL